jgi:hypothetical protein
VPEAGAIAAVVAVCMAAVEEAIGGTTLRKEARMDAGAIDRGKLDGGASAGMQGHGCDRRGGRSGARAPPSLWAWLPGREIRTRANGVESVGVAAREEGVVVAGL